MGGRKKTFACGHRGRGHYCHRCAQEAAATEQASAERARKTEARVELDAAWCGHFPRQDRDGHRFPGATRREAIRLADELAAGRHYSKLNGHRLTPDPANVRFELPGSYRLIGRLGPGDVIDDLRVMSHAEYNRFFRE